MRNIISLIYIKRNLLVFGVIFSSLGYLFSIGLTSAGVILLVAFWLLNFKKLTFSHILKPNVLHVLVIFFLLLIIASFYSEHLQQAQKYIVRHLSFVLLPLVFLTIRPFNKKEYEAVIKVYIYTVTALFIICFFNACYRQFIFTNEGGHFNWYFFYRYDFLEIFAQHPTYTSMYVLLALSFILNSGKSFFKRNWIYVLFILTQVISIVLYGSRIAYIILFILFLAYALKSLKNKSKNDIVKAGSFYLILLVVLIFTSWNIPIVKERILFTFGYQQDYKFNNQETIKDNTPEEQGRLLLWKDAVELIKEKPFFGYGTGSNKIILQEKYREKGHLLFLNKKYDSHNTYLDLLLIGGIPLLFAYLVILGAIVARGIKNKNFVLFSFFLIISITGLTETIFRAQGIVFVAFFYCFLLSNNKHNE
jgi:O-antigen ligase